jgi:hypothetical protein
MTADLIRELQQIQRYAAGLHELLAQAQTQAPRRAEGTDRSGGVRVVLGPDGFPETIRVDSGWERRLAPEAFGGAVGEAFSAAMGERLAAWTDTLRQQGWQSDIDRLKGAADRSPEAPPALRRPTPPRSRPIGDVAEDMIKAFDTVDAMARPPAPASGTGSAAGGRLTITLAGNGALSCTAEPQWVSRQSPAALMSALNEALHAARADLARQHPPAAATTGRLDGLLDEAFALLSDPRRLTN